MGSLEDHYRQEERRKENDQIREANQKLDEALAMIPRVDAHLRVNPPSSHDIAWLHYEGEVRVVWKMGTFTAEPNERTVSMFLIPKEQKLVTATSGMGYSPEQPFEEWTPLALIPAQTAREAWDLRHKIDPLNITLFGMLPHEKERRRRFRLW